MYLCVPSYSWNKSHYFPAQYLAEVDCVLCEVRTESLYTVQFDFSFRWLRRLFAALSTRSTGFDSRSVNMSFVLNEVTLEQLSARVLPAPLVSQYPYSSSFRRCSHRKDKWTTTGNVHTLPPPPPPKKAVLFQKWGSTG